MIALTLRQIADLTDGELRLDGTDVDAATVITGAVETDTRDIRPGGVFVAKPGEFTDGHLFAPAAVEAGAALVLVERQLDLAVPQIVVANVLDAIAALAAEVVARVRALGTMRIVGVTGSNGKTTTKNLLRAICSLAGETVASRASYNNEVGGPITMLEITEQTAFLVAEMGASHVGDIARLVRLARPDVGIVLKVGLAHAGEFGGIERTVLAKSEMVTELLPTDTAVLNQDDPRVAGMAESTAATVLWFGEDADVRASDVEISASGTTFVLHLPTGESRPVVFAVLGEHHVANALAAAAAAHALGIDIDTIVTGLESVTMAERWRMQVVATDPITIINDAYNASPDSMSAALRTLIQIAPGRSVAVLGEMTELGDLSTEEHDSIGRLVVRLNIGQLIVVGQGAKAIHLAASMEGSWDGESLWVATQEEAEELLAEILQDGDTVLVKSSNAAGLRHLGDRLVDLVPGRVA